LITGPGLATSIVTLTGAAKALLAAMARLKATMRVLIHFMLSPVFE